MTVSQQNWVSSNRGDSPTSNRKWLQNRRQPVTPPPSDRVVNSLYRWTSSSSTGRAQEGVAETAAPSIRAPRRLFADTEHIYRAVPFGLIWQPTPIPTVRSVMEQQEQMPECSGTSYGPSVRRDSSSSFMPCSSTSMDMTSTISSLLFPRQSYSYQDSEHPSLVMNAIGDLRSNQELCDVQLKAEDKSIFAHRCVLSAAIPYFRSMFLSGWKESEMEVIVINEISFEALQKLVDFAYTSTIHFDGIDVQQLLFAASVLQMDRVSRACQAFLSKLLTTENVISLQLFAEQHNCVDLITNTNAFAVDNFLDICRMEDFVHIPFNNLRDMLQRDDLNLEREEQVFDAVIRWIEVDPEDRERHLPELLKCVRRSQLSLQTLDMMRNHQYIKSSHECCDLISDALFEILSPLKDSKLSVQSAFQEEGGAQYSVHGITTLSRPSTTEVGRTRPRMSVAGVVFCAGGRGTQGDPFRSVEAYDWRNDKWFSIGEMQQQRRHVGVVSAGGKLYAIGGHDGRVHLDSAEVFDPVIGTWQRVNPMNVPRRGIAVAHLDGAIYAVGGLDDQTCFDTVERYDIELNQWTIVAKMTVQRGGVGCAALGKSLIAIGGNNGASSLDSCERYDPHLNRWKMIKSMSHRRAGAGVCVLDGFLYAVGGFDDNAPLSTVEKYDIRENTWTQLANMSSPRGGVGVAAMGGRLYAIGGHDGNKYLKTVEVYTPHLDTWEPIAEIRECRAGAGVAWADCRITVLQACSKDSGYSPNGASNSI